MTPVRAKSNMLSLPCPKCHKPNPVESGICACGHRLIKQEVSAVTVAAPFPDIQSILPELKKKPANLRLVVPAEAKPESPAPTRPKLVEVSSSTVDSPMFELPQSGFRQRRRVYGVVFAGLVLSTAFAAYLAGFIEVPASLKQNAEPLRLTQSETAAAGDEQNSIDKVAETTVGEQTAGASDGSEAVTGTAVKTPSARPNEKRVAVSDPKVIDAEPKSTETATADNQPAPATPEKEPANTAVAVARCGDGTYSYRKSASVTCAYRGGVAKWLDGTKPSPSAAKLPKPETDRAYVLGSRGGCYYTTASGSKKYVDKSYCN